MTERRHGYVSEPAAAHREPDGILRVDRENAGHTVGDRKGKLPVACGLSRPVRKRDIRFNGLQQFVGWMSDDENPVHIWVDLA